jgi:hypothetical protein
MTTTGPLPIECLKSRESTTTGSSSVTGTSLGGSVALGWASTDQATAAAATITATLEARSNSDGICSFVFGILGPLKMRALEAAVSDN